MRSGRCGTASAGLKVHDKPSHARFVPREAPARPRAALTTHGAPSAFVRGRLRLATWPALAAAQPPPTLTCVRSLKLTRAHGVIVRGRRSSRMSTAACANLRRERSASTKSPRAVNHGRPSLSSFAPPCGWFRRLLASCQGSFPLQGHAPPRWGRQRRRRHASGAGSGRSGGCRRRRRSATRLEPRRQACAERPRLLLALAGTEQARPAPCRVSHLVGRHGLGYGLRLAAAHVTRAAVVHHRRCGAPPPPLAPLTAARTLAQRCALFGFAEEVAQRCFA